MNTLKSLISSARRFGFSVTKEGETYTVRRGERYRVCRTREELQSAIHELMRAETSEIERKEK